MYITIPLILIGISLLGIVVIVYRKLPYLRKLSPDAHQVSENLANDYFPELVEWYSRIPWREYRQNILRETEKLLRRLRLVLLKVDHISDRLIKKVRRTHLETSIESAAIEAEKPSKVEEEEKIEAKTQPAVEPTPEELRAKEQQLIIDISQDPKNASLYEILGDVYAKMGVNQDAKEAYEAALGLNPDNKDIARKYSMLLRKEEREAGTK